MRKILSLLLGITMLLSAFGALSEGVDLNSYTLDEIIAKAKEEGHVESVGMPDSWANWGDSWKGLTATYGIAHTDEDMSSAEELSMFQNDFTRDIGDIGLGFITQALENDLVVRNDQFLALGLNPITLSEGLLREINETAGRYADRADHSRIPATSLWTKNQQPGIPSSVTGSN